MEVPILGPAPLPGPANTWDPADTWEPADGEARRAARPAVQLVYAEELKKMDAGGAFYVVVDYDGQREPQRGYLPVSKGELVGVTPNSRQPGDVGNRYKEYVYGRRVKPPFDEGWLPLYILVLEEWMEEA